MIDLAAVWATYGGAIETVVAGVGGWCANMGRVYVAGQRVHLDAGQQALAILDRATAREVRMDALLADLTGRVNDLMRQRWHSDDVLQDLYAQAISARLAVQEMDARAGRAPREFPPLPPYPYPPADQRAAPDGAPAAGATAADTAGLHADNMHG